MDGIKYRATDVFRYSLPGCLLIFALSLVISEVKVPKDIVFVLLPMLDIKNGVVILITGYIVGFTIDPTGGWLRRLVPQKIYKTPSLIVDNKNITKSDWYIALKLVNSQVYDIVETWDMLKNMASNLAIGFIFISLVCVYKIIWIYPSGFKDWLSVLILSVLSAAALLWQSLDYEQWSVNDIKAAIKNAKSDLIKDLTV